MVAWLPEMVLVGATVNSLMYVTSTPGTQPVVEPPPLPEPEEPPLEPPPGSPPGRAGGGGGEGTLGAGGGLGADGHGTGCLSWTVKPWSLTLTGWPFTVTWPATTCASPLAPETVLVALT